MFDIRLKVIAAVVLVMMVTVIARMGYMQVAMCDYYREEGRKQQIRDLTVPAPRGLITARDGTILAEDYPTWSVCVVLKEFYTLSPEGMQNWYATVARIVGDTPSGVADQVRRVYYSIEARIARQAQNTVDSGKDSPEREREHLLDKARRDAKNNRDGEYRRKQSIYIKIPWNMVARAEVASADLPGLAVGESMTRRYPMGSLACHAIGMVGEARPEEVEMYALDYNGDERKSVRAEDAMGRTGLERQYNFSLRGSRGETKAIVNAHGQNQVILSDTQPEIGSAIAVGIDPILQSVAEKSLFDIFQSEHHPGAAVCMDAHTGEVLVMASCPGYDLNTFSANFTALIDVKNPDGIAKYHPLVNRAVGAGYPLGSVFKIITTTAALEAHAITPETVFTCNGKFEFGKKEYHCDVYRPPAFLTHGPLDLLDGFKKSCNIYFFNAGLRAGGDNLYRWALKYGLGSQAGVDLPDETSGKLPLPRVPGDTINLSIGQGELLASPVQACRLAAAVANGGMLVTPHLCRTAPVGKPDPVGLSPSTLDILRRGMYKVVNEEGGTAYRVARSDVMVFSGKTGTAQAPPQGDQIGDHAWFVGFAPSDHPEIAFAIVVEHGGHGGTAAAPVAKAIVEAYAAEKAGAVKQ